MPEPADPDDHALMVDLARGNLQALAGLYRRHGALVYHLLVAQTGDPDTAQDLIYRREGRGFVLYSVGLNQQDDGGVSEIGAPPNVQRDADIVWRVGG